MHRRHTLSRLTALAAAAAAAVALTACTPADTDTDGERQDDTAQSLGSVAIFTPSDGLTISQRTPLNKWQAIVPEITDALAEQGFEAADIATVTSDTLDRQSRDIQDYVVDNITSDDDEAVSNDITLIVAPVADAGDSTRQYGDYVSTPITWQDDGAAADGSDSEAEADDADGADAESDSDDGTDTDTDAEDAAGDVDDDTVDDGELSDEETARRAAERLVSALDLAQEAGMQVVLLANQLEGFVPDAFVEISDAEGIGAIQAQKVVDKLELDSTSTDNPKAIEVLLPYDAEDGSDNTFAREAFAGIWGVLGPYFEEGTAVSPSGLLDADSTADDWMAVAFDAADDQTISDELTERLGMEDDQSAHTRIDGVIAMNDYVASAVTDCLTTLGYVGTSADINPSISISGIVGNITGQVDLQKEAVPDPIKAPEEAGPDDDGEVDIEQINSQWPIVTGYGAYLDIIPQIVDGQQWMTALEDRLTLSDDIAEACARLVSGQSLDDLDYVTQADYDDMQVPTISEPLLAVSASNLKDTLIDPGYITLADAGL